VVDATGEVTKTLAKAEEKRAKTTKVVENIVVFDVKKGEWVLVKRV